MSDGQLHIYDGGQIRGVLQADGSAIIIEHDFASNEILMPVNDHEAGKMKAYIDSSGNLYIREVQTESWTDWALSYKPDFDGFDIWAAGWVVLIFMVLLFTMMAMVELGKEVQKDREKRKSAKIVPSVGYASNPSGDYDRKVYRRHNEQ